MTSPSCFPELPFLDVEHVRKTIAGLTVVVRTTTSTSICPVCGQASSRVHSRYTRTLADLPWSGRTVQLHVQVRRFARVGQRAGASPRDSKLQHNLQSSSHHPL
jgi:transposase